MAATILAVTLLWLFIGLIVLIWHDTTFHMKMRTPMEDFEMIVLWPTHLKQR